MDANGARFWQLADAAHWRAGEHVRWDAACGALTLASERRLDTPPDAAAQAAATAALDEVPRAVDVSQGVARWSAAFSAVVVRSTLPGEVLLLSPAQAPTDLCVDGEGVFHVVMADGVLLHDLRGRFEDATVEPPAGFTPWRAAAVAGEGGLFLLERDSGRIARLSGRPMPVTTPPRAAYAPAVFRPQPENCRPPRMDLIESPGLAAGERAIAIAAFKGVLGVLTWDATFQPRLHLRRDGAWAAPLALGDARYAYTLAWLDEGRFAVRLPMRREAPAFEPGTSDPPAQPLLPLGTVYPLPAGTPEASFAHRLDGPPQVPQAEGGAEPLFPLSRRFLAPSGEARHWRVVGSGESARLDAQVLDSGQPATVWHRLFAEASIPEGCGFVVWLSATADNAPPADDDGAWQPHAFGQDVAALAGDALTRETPRAAWERAPSELPNHSGLARWTPQRDRRGLFSVLIQAGAQRVRRLVGRFLWVRVQLWGNVRSAPEIAALRAWASRFDYVDQYLPRLYRESLFGASAQSPGEELRRVGTNVPVLVDELDAGTLPAALSAGFGTAAGLPPAGVRVQVEQAGQRWRLRDDAGGASWPLRLATTQVAGADVHELVLYRPRATPSDFLSRQLASFEGVLTALEDRVAAAHLLFDPAVVPEANLEWLSAWVGVAFDPVLPAARRRAWLLAAPQLARWHGTRRGLSMALDVATGASVESDAQGRVLVGRAQTGGVSGGEIVVVEDFRLRRLMATLLGVDLADEEDPLLGGLARSGNSLVGDTLVLGDHETAELMALFRDEQSTAAQDAAARGFYGRLAHRVTVLVHREVQAQDFALIRRIAELESPAHVQVRVAGATWPLLVGVASLVGVDTYLGPPRPVRPARVQVSSLGLGDVVVQPALLDARLGGSPAPLVPDAPPAPAPEPAPEPAPSPAPAPAPEPAPAPAPEPTPPAPEPSPAPAPAPEPAPAPAPEPAPAPAPEPAPPAPEPAPAPAPGPAQPPAPAPAPTPAPPVSEPVPPPSQEPVPGPAPSPEAQPPTPGPENT